MKQTAILALGLASVLVSGPACETKTTPAKAKTAKACPEAKPCGGGLALTAQTEAYNGARRSVLEPEFKIVGPGGKKYSKGPDEGMYVRGRLAAGSYTVSAQMEGYLTETRTVKVDAGFIEPVSFKLKPAGYVRHLGDKPLTSLKNLRGESVTSRGGFPTTVYKLPGSEDIHIAVAQGIVTRVPEKAEPAPNGNVIVVAGKKFVLDKPVRVVLWDQEGGHDFPAISANNKKKGKDPLFSRRVRNEERVSPMSLSALRETVHMVMLHSNMQDTAKEGFDELVKRKLSTHFHIDFDGTIYQGMDVGYQSFHGGVANSTSIGIDLANAMPNLAVKKTKDALPYDPKHVRAAEMAKHPRKKSKLTKYNYGRVQSYGPTEAQYRAVGALLRALTTIFPRIARSYPQTDKGEFFPRALKDGVRFEGIVAHMHVSATRWDPGPGFEWKRLAEMFGE